MCLKFEAYTTSIALLSFVCLFLHVTVMVFVYLHFEAHNYLSVDLWLPRLAQQIALRGLLKWGRPTHVTLARPTSHRVFCAQKLRQSISSRFCFPRTRGQAGAAIKRSGFVAEAAPAPDLAAARQPGAGCGAGVLFRGGRNHLDLAPQFQPVCSLLCGFAFQVQDEPIHFVGSPNLTPGIPTSHLLLFLDSFFVFVL